MSCVQSRALNDYNGFRVTQNAVATIGYNEYATQDVIAEQWRVDL